MASFLERVELAQYRAELAHLWVHMLLARTREEKLSVQIALTLLAVRASQSLPVSTPLEVVIKIMLEILRMYQSAADGSLQKALLKSMMNLWYAMANLEEVSIAQRVLILTPWLAGFLDALFAIPDLVTRTQNLLK